MKFKQSIRTWTKGDLRDFERGMVVGARRAGLSISEAADLLGLSPITISRVYREWSEKGIISSERQFSGINKAFLPRGEWPDWFKMIERQQ